MRRVRRFQIAQNKCLVIKYAKDTRYSSSFSTHDRLVLPLSCENPLRHTVTVPGPGSLSELEKGQAATGLKWMGIGAQNLE